MIYKAVKGSGLEWIKYYQEKLRIVGQEELKPAQKLYIKSDELTFVDPISGKTFKRIFKSNLNLELTKNQEQTTAKILEIKEGTSYTDVVLEYIPGADLAVLLKAEPTKINEYLHKFDHFFCHWVQYDPSKDYLDTYNTDFNPGNFIYNHKEDSFKRIDFVSDWQNQRVPLYFYLVPYYKLQVRNHVNEEDISSIIDSRFANHKSQKITYQLLLSDLKKHGCPEISDLI